MLSNLPSVPHLGCGLKLSRSSWVGYPGAVFLESRDQRPSSRWMQADGTSVSAPWGTPPTYVTTVSYTTLWLYFLLWPQEPLSLGGCLFPDQRTWVLWLPGPSSCCSVPSGFPHGVFPTFPLSDDLPLLWTPGELADLNQPVQHRTSLALCCYHDYFTSYGSSFCNCLESKVYLILSLAFPAQPSKQGRFLLCTYWWILYVTYSVIYTCGD